MFSTLYPPSYEISITFLSILPWFSLVFVFIFISLLLIYLYNMDTKKIKTISTPVVIENKILMIRGQKVMLDSDLAEIYQIQTKVLLQAIKRNKQRFPEDFMFQLEEDEYKSLRSQFVTSYEGRGGRRYLPYAFTEHGVAMLSSVLNSPRAIQMNIFIIRAFIQLREVFLQDQDFEIRIIDLESIQKLQGEELREILEHLRYLTRHPLKPLGPIGFQP